MQQVLSKDFFRNIEPASEEDYLAITETWEASVRATHHFLREEHIQYFKPLILNEFLKTVDLYCIKSNFVNIAGFIGVAESKIEMLFVHPEFFGRSIGKSLLRFAVEKLGATKVDVNEQNEQAVNFYKHMSFIVTGRSELDSMGKPFPLLFMELDKKAR